MTSETQKNDESITDKLLMTLMDEVKNMKLHINTYVNSPSTVSQRPVLVKTESNSSSSSLPINKFEPSMHCGKKIHHESMFYSRTSAQVINVSQILVLVKTEGPSRETSSRNKPLAPKTFPECIYCGRFDHHFNDYGQYPGCNICGSVAHVPVKCPVKPTLNRKPMMSSENPLNPLESGFTKETKCVLKWMCRIT